MDRTVFDAIVVDASVFVAVATEEPGFERYVRRMSQADGVCTAAPTALEAEMVLGSRATGDSDRMVSEMLKDYGGMIEPFDEEALSLAIDAFRRFGKGRHPARLNFGDCMAYALAKKLDAALLFVGTDFHKTDVRVADLEG